MELAEVAAGLPVAASFALAGGITTLREGRRRTALNEAMHELRRPLQALSFALPDSNRGSAVDSSLRLTMAALDRLDREINGGAAAEGREVLSARALLEEAAARWRSRAAAAGADLRLRWHGRDVRFEADAIGLGQALDNLISNALAHGGGSVLVEGGREGGCLLLRVCDGGGGSAGPRGRRRRRLRAGGRHGHGLRVVARVARTHGGSFRLRLRRRGGEARLRLPVGRSGEER